MASLPALTIAVMNDLHVGLPPGGGFQNTFLTDDATAILIPTIEAINAANPDLVLIPGDLTHDATSDQLTIAADCLSRIRAPWLACKGNHDRETPAAAARFDETFGRHVLPGITRGGEIGLPPGIAIFILESAWGDDGSEYDPENPPLATVDDDLMDAALARLEEDRPELLLVVSHYPLLSQADYVSSVNGRYAGHVECGQQLLDELLMRAGAVVCLCGHNHYHHISSGNRWLQCATGALAEFPAEFRLVSVEDGLLTVSSATGARDVLTRATPPENVWVAGRREDREFTWRPE